MPDEAPDLALVGDTIRVQPSTVSEQSLLSPYARFRSDPFHALSEFGSHIYGTEWRSYSSPIGQQVFYPGFSENMKAKVMRQTTLQRKIAQLAQKRIEVEIHKGFLGPKGLDGETAEHKRRRRERKAEIIRQLQDVADGWTDQMICKMESNYFIRGAYYLCTQLLTRAYHQGIHVNSEEVRHLREVAAEAAKKKQGIIFLPCHRSHVDYVSLQLICFRLGLVLPTVVAGDNLNFPVVGPFLQHAGAMWIRRSFGDDQLYTTLVQSYMDTLLQEGFNVECFIEGGRSRTGKLLQPKFGILSFFLDSVLSGRVEDALVCPVSTQYDKVIEVDSYISELLGQPKQKENLAGFLSATNVLSLKLGRVDVRFQKPWSLREFIDDNQTRLSRSLTPAQQNDGTVRRRILTTLGYKVLMDINTVSVVMPTALVGTVLLTLRGRGVGKSELVRRVEWLSARVRAAGGRIAHIGATNTDAVVERALEVLGPKLVGRIQDLPEETFYAEDRFQLSFYRNMTIHLFISQALTCAAVYTKVKQGGNQDLQRISYSELVEYVRFLSQLFRAEFIFETTPLEENIRRTLEGLVQDRVLATLNVDGIDYVELHPDQRASGREDFDFYCFLIWPFIEATWLGAVSLFMLSPPINSTTAPPLSSEPRWLDDRTFQNKAQLLGKTLYHQGDLSYFEAVNKEALKNAFSRSEEAGIIHVFKTKDAKSPPVVRLDAEWMPSRNPQDGSVILAGKLWEFCEHISASRREGKNRRDGNTVRRRVLGLVDLVGKDLWEQQTASADELIQHPGASAAPGSKKKKARRRKGISVKANL